MQTKLTEMFEIPLPILGAPMFLISHTDLVVAVSEAGGMGCFPAVNYRTITELKEAISEIKSRTKAPFGVNVIFSKVRNPLWSQQIEACIEGEVKLIITSMGTPRTILSDIKKTSTKVFSDIITLRHALIVTKAGVDGLIPVSQGAGGHAGTINPFSLIPFIKKETGLPIIAAGCITNGQQMAAAMSLGADGVYVGTRLIATTESKAPDEYKQMILESIPEEIEYTDRVSGIHANWMKKSLKRFDSGKNAKQWKDVYSAGQGVGQINEIKGAKILINEMKQDYLSTIKNLPR